MALEMVINSEQTAWEALERALNERDSLNVQFDDWPEVSLVFRGDRYSSSLPSGVMHRVSLLQQAVNRVYGRLAYGGSGKNLSEEDRSDLELLFEIEEGSTQLKADATGLLNRLGDALSRKPTQQVASITLILLALIVTGGVVLASDSDRKREVDLRRLEIFRRAIEVAPQMKDAPEEFRKAYGQILLAAGDADTVTIANRTFSPVEVAAFAAGDRIGARITLNDQFSVIGWKTYRKFTVIELRQVDGRTFKARVWRHKFSEDELKILSDALALKTKVSLEVVALEHAGEISSARIASIRR